MGVERRRLSTKLRAIYAEALRMVTPGKFASEQPIPDVYTGAFRGGPARIDLKLNVERLSCEVRKAFESIPSLGREIGGLLLGTTDLHAHRIEIKDFEPFLSEYRTDHKFILSEADQRKLEEVLVVHANDLSDGLKVVGFCRSRTGEGLSMSQHDVSLAQEYFNHPTQVFLPVKPAADGSSSAGFFFWDNDRIGPDFSYPEFPFDARQLATALEIPADSSTEGKEQRLASVLRWRWFPIVAALVVAMTALGYIALQKRAASLAPTSVASQTAGLALEIERHENDLRLRWNVNSAVVYYAKDAMLSIHDGNSLQEIHLDRKQLFNSSVVYRPVNAAVQFRLEITALDNTKTSEYVLVLRAAAANVLGATSIAATSRTDAPRKRPRLAGLLSGKKPLVQSIGKLPFICSAGDVIRKTDAPPGWDIFVCRSKNVWSLVGDAAIAGNRTASLAKKRN